MNKMIPTKLTKRLEEVFNLIPEGEVMADIGTDHGYLAASLIERTKAKFVIAADVNEGPLATATEYITERGLFPMIDCRLGDGLTVLKEGEASVVTICGMGGFLMRDLLEAAPYLPKHLVLQPQNGQAELRQYLIQQGYHVVRESLVEDMGRLYECGHWELGNEPCRYYGTLPKESMLWRTSAYIQEEGHPLGEVFLRELCEKEEKHLESMRKGNANEETLQSTKTELKRKEEVYHDYCKRHCK